MKTTITTRDNNVTVSRDDPMTGERETTTYFVPHEGGYVRIRDSAGRDPQVCEKLYFLGDTLRSTVEGLPALIRRELRRRVADEQREF